MALQPLTYSKDWSVEDASSDKYFPTHEANETQVRADLQLLYNEIRTWANTLVEDGLTDASNIGLGEQTVLEADTVKGALLELYELIQDITQGAIPNHSITKIKLTDVNDEAGAAVGEDNIEADAVTESKIKDNEISTGKIKNGAITGPKLASDVDGVNSAVDTNNIKNQAVTNAKIKNYDLTHNKLATKANPNGAAVDKDNIVAETITNAEIAPNANIAASKLAGDIPKSKLATAVQTSLTDADSHVANTSNPHSTTYSQVGLSYEEWTFTPKTGEPFTVKVAVVPDA